MNPFAVQKTKHEGVAIAKSSYNRVAPTSSATKDAFYGNAHRFRWDSSGSDWTALNESYLKARVSLTKPDGTALEASDQLGLTRGCLANLFTKLELRINDQTVSRVEGSVGEIDSLLHRQQRSPAWMDTIGELNLYGKDLDERIQVTASDGLQQGTISSQPDKIANKVDLGYNLAESGIALDATNPDLIHLVITFGATLDAVFTDPKYVGPTQNGKVHDDFPVGCTVYTPWGANYEITGHGSGGKLIVGNWVDEGTQTLNLGDFGTASRRGAVEKSRRVQNLELCWDIMPLSLMRSNMCIPPGASFELLMTVSSEDATGAQAVESRSGAAAVPGTDFKFQVTDLSYMVKTYSGDRTHEGEAVFDVSNVGCRKIATLQQPFTGYQTQVSSATRKLTFAFQDKRTGVCEHSASEFIDSLNSVEALERYNVQYDNQVKPSQDAALEFTKGTDFLVGEQYLQTQNSNGFVDTDCGCESMRDFKERGVYFSHEWERDGSSYSTSAMINCGFKGGTDVSNVNLLVFDESYSTITLDYQGGRVVDIKVEDR